MAVVNLFNLLQRTQFKIGSREYQLLREMIKAIETLEEELDQEVKFDEFTQPIRCLAVNTATQPVNTSTDTNVIFSQFTDNTGEFTIDGNSQLALNSGQGIFQVECNVTWEANTTGRRILRLEPAGVFSTTPPQIIYQPPSAAMGMSLVGRTERIYSGQVINCVVNQNSGVQLTIGSVTAQFHSRISILKLSE